MTTARMESLLLLTETGDEHPVKTISTKTTTTKRPPKLIKSFLFMIFSFVEMYFMNVNILLKPLRTARTRNGAPCRLFLEFFSLFQNRPGCAKFHFSYSFLMPFLFVLKYSTNKRKSLHLFNKSFSGRLV